MTAISVEHLSKRFRLGLTHSGSVREAVNRSIRRLLNKSNDARPEVAPELSSRVDDHGYFWALNDVSFEIPQGEVVGIIGKNGAGKSTLLKILSRISSPTAGRITLHGQVASLLEVGTGFHPELTGRENVYLNGTILGMTRQQITRCFESIVDFAGIETFIDTPVKRYSSGMTVRLGFAVAAHLEPEILIVDEVLAVGDVEFQKKCLGKMREVSQSGRTVLFVSHNMSSIRALTSTSLLISRGTILAQGPTNEVLHQYLTTNSAQTSMNADVRTAERPFSGLTREIQLTRLALNTSTIPAGQGLAFELELEDQVGPTEFEIGLTILRTDGSTIGSTFSRPLQSSATDNTTNFQCILPCRQLTPGSYYCAISLGDVRSSGRRLFDSLSEILPFEVVSPDLTERPWNSSWGSIHFDELETTEDITRNAN